MTDINEQAIREAATRYVDDLFRKMDMLDSNGDRHIVDFTDGELEQAFVVGMRAASAEHPNATDWQNRSERAEQEAAELREKNDALMQQTLVYLARKVFGKD